jgi:Uma2 family endonuclease
MWEGDWELIDGLPVAMSPSPKRKHQGIGGKIYSHIRNAMDQAPDTCGNCEVVYELDWIVSDTTVLRPDIAVICDEAGDFISHAPVLLVEILSPSTALKDRHVKYEMYQEQGVRYYIIVDPATMSYRAYQLRDGAYYDYMENTFLIHAGCTISMDVQALLAEIKD